MRAEKISALRASLSRPRLETKLESVSLGYDVIDLCLNGGLQRGVLHEVFAAIGHEAAATGFVAGMAARLVANKRLLWIQQDFSAHEFGELSATGLVEFGLSPSSVLLLSVADAADGLRAANDALSCTALGAVVVEIPGRPKALDLMASRRLALACQQKAVTAILLRFGAQIETSAATTRWFLRAAPSPMQEEIWGYPIFEVDLIRNRNGRTGRWVIAWSCDHGLFQNPAAYHSALVSTASDRQTAATYSGIKEIYRLAV